MSCSPFRCESGNQLLSDFSRLGGSKRRYRAVLRYKPDPAQAAEDMLLNPRPRTRQFENAYPARFLKHARLFRRTRPVYKPTANGSQIHFCDLHAEFAARLNTPMAGSPCRNFGEVVRDRKWRAFGVYDRHIIFQCH